MKDLPRFFWTEVCKDEEDRPEDYSTEDLEKLKWYHEYSEAGAMTRMHPQNAEYMHFTEGGQHYLPKKHRIKYYSHLVTLEQAAAELRRSRWGCAKTYNRICDELERRKKEETDE